MQLVAGYFELYSLRRFVEQAKTISERHQQVLQYTGAIATAEGFESAAMNLCNELATRTGALRVALGWVKGVKIKVKALSHTEKFDKKQELIVQLEKAMEECLDQEEPVRYDPGGRCTGNVSRAAQELSRAQGGNIVMSMPLRHREDIVGVLTVEWAGGTQVDEGDEAGVAVSAELLAPQLYDRYQNDRFIITKLGHSITHVAKLTVGPKYTGTKLLIALGISLVLFVCLFKPMYHVRSAVVLNAMDKRTISAPWDGRIDQVLKRPGEVVKEGEVIARLRTAELVVKREEAQARVHKAQVAADKARNERKPAEQRISEWERDEAQRQVDLLDRYIAMADLKSPMDGVLLKGDLMDRVGMPAKEGEPLFEVAKSDGKDPGRLALEAELQVSDHDIQDLAEAVHKRQEALKRGEKVDDYDGELATTSFPSEGFKFVVTRIVPVGEPKEGENVFKVYATIQDPAAWMHPGLAGDARVNIEKRTLVWMWTHRLIDWIKLKLWI